ncbi:MAG: hypothetical protein IPF57_11935 [Gammaproteobacteria bacterium]|nr:hypothetical protein [Gammaproteobacteria bacterium]
MVNHQGIRWNYASTGARSTHGGLARCNNNECSRIAPGDRLGIWAANWSSGA